MFETALVALDMSPAERPMLSCLDEIGALGVKRLVLMHVVEVDSISGAEYGHEEQIAVRLKTHADKLETAGFEVTTEVRDSGDVPGTILRAAADHAADLIVVGKHGQNWVESTVIGSTAANLCEIARRPVLMAPLNESEA
jgi:nucleotide-binding universal stress UspA family protein